ncbi:MAG: NUDIX hydrolase [Clostridiales bacterium]|nr:NUDIX hydrolase [Clostridiales bacterium]
MELPHEKAYESNVIYDGKIIKVRVDKVVFPDGKKSVREVCEHVGGVGVLPVDDEGYVYLVRQFRYPYGEELYEIPAGKLDLSDTETPLDCGIRELKEETGFSADKIEHLGKIYPSPGFLTEILYLFKATGLHMGDSETEDDEFLALTKFSAEEVRDMILRGEIRDAKTIAAMYMSQLQNKQGDDNDKDTCG